MLRGTFSKLIFQPRMSSHTSNCQTILTLYTCSPTTLLQFQRPLQHIYMSVHSFLQPLHAVFSHNFHVSCNFSCSICRMDNREVKKPLKNKNQWPLNLKQGNFKSVFLHWCMDIGRFSIPRMPISDLQVQT